MELQQRSLFKLDFPFCHQLMAQVELQLGLQLIPTHVGKHLKGSQLSELQQAYP